MAATSEEACRRIEQAVLRLLRGLGERPRRATLVLPGAAAAGKQQVLSYRAGRTRRPLCCLVRVLALVHQRLAAQDRRGLTKRAVFYADKALFEDQRQSDKAIERAALLLGLQRSELCVFASPRGFMCGDLGLELDDGTVLQLGSRDGTDWEERPVLDEWCGRVRRVRSSAQCIVVVEKYSFFHDFVRHPLVRSRLPACVFVTSCGYPVRAVSEVLGVVCDALCLPCAVLVDFDPYGVDIFCRYRAVVPDAVLVALHADDAEAAPERCRLALSPADVARGTSLLGTLERDEDGGDGAAALRWMLQTRTKLELEAVHESDALLERVVDRIAQCCELPD